MTLNRSISNLVVAELTTVRATLVLSHPDDPALIKYETVEFPVTSAFRAALEQAVADGIVFVEEARKAAEAKAKAADDELKRRAAETEALQRERAADERLRTAAAAARLAAEVAAEPARVAAEVAARSGLK